MDADGDDPFDSLTKLCVVSESQEEILRHCAFAGDPINVRGSGSLSQLLQLPSTGVPTASLPETSKQRERNAPREAPPEPTGEQRAIAVDDPSLEVAATGVEGGFVGGVAAEVDLGKNPDLGFRLEVEPTQETPEIEILGVRRREVSESEAGGGGKSARKKLKSSKVAIGTTSYLPIIIEDSDEELVSVDGEDSGQLGDNGEETNNGTRRVLPSSLSGAKKKDATPSDSFEKQLSSRLTNISKIDVDDELSEEDKKLAEMSLLKIVSLGGWTFPRPCWWREGWDFSFK